MADGEGNSYDDTGVHERITAVDTEVKAIREGLASIATEVKLGWKNIEDRLDSMALHTQSAKTPWMPIVTIMVGMTISGAGLNAYIMRLHADVARAQTEGARVLLQSEIDVITEDFDVLVAQQEEWRTLTRRNLYEYAQEKAAHEERLIAIEALGSHLKTKWHVDLRDAEIRLKEQDDFRMNRLELGVGDLRAGHGIPNDPPVGGGPRSQEGIEAK